MKKNLLTLLLSCLLVGALSGCSTKEEKSEANLTTSTEITEETENTTESVGDANVTEEVEATTENTEFCESDKYYLWWLRGQDLTGTPKEQPAEIPLYGGIETPIDLENQIFSTWVARIGWNEDRTEMVYKNVSEVLADENEIVRHNTDTFYYFQKEIDSGVDIYVTFYNNTDTDITVKQAYENGWFSIWYPNSAKEANGSYKHDSVLFEAFGYEINENYSRENYNDYAFMEYLLNTLGNPNFLSVHVGTGYDYREFEEYFELIKEKRNTGLFQVILGWEYEDYCMYVTLEDNVKYTTNDSVEYYDISWNQFDLAGLDIYPSTAYYWINHEKTYDADKDMHVGENVLDKWNKAIANGDIPTSVVVYE